MSSTLSWPVECSFANERQGGIPNYVSCRKNAKTTQLDWESGKPPLPILRRGWGLGWRPKLPRLSSKLVKAGIMREVLDALEVFGKNRLQRQGKNRLQRQGNLPLQIECNENLVSEAYCYLSHYANAYLRRTQSARIGKKSNSAYRAPDQLLIAIQRPRWQSQLTPRQQTIRLRPLEVQGRGRYRRQPLKTSTILSIPWCQEVRDAVAGGIRRYSEDKKRRMPTNVKTYDGIGDPDWLSMEETPATRIPPKALKRPPSEEHCRRMRSPID
ncbi:hypothetical protein Tco_0503946 [Tanacetum coccineum]